MTVNWERLQSVAGAIVVVEDDPILRELMAYVLTEIGAESVLFNTADEALTYLLVSHDQCPMVIADYGVPGQVKGIEFINMVQSRWPSIRAILTSGYLINSLDVPHGALYLHKPWSLDEMIAAVGSLLQPDNPIQRL